MSASARSADQTGRPTGEAVNDGEDASPTVRVLIVCTANICRSPVVEAILRQRLHQRGLRWQVASAGTLAMSGYAASKHGVEVLAVRGLDISGHRSHEVTSRDVQDADLVLCMEQGHVEALRIENREHSAKIQLLTAMIGYQEDVADPYGGPRPWYEVMVDQVTDLVDRGLDRIVELANTHFAARTDSSI